MTKSTVAEALRLLRAADPAAGLHAPNATDASAAVQAFKARLPGSDDISYRVELPPEGNRARRRWLAPALAAVGVIAVAAASVVLISHNTGRTSNIARPESGPVPAAHDPNYAATVRRIADILDTAPALPHAISAAKPPEPKLAGLPQFVFGTTHLQLSRIKWETAPGTTAAAVAFYESHRPWWTGISGIIQPTPQLPYTELYYVGPSSLEYQDPSLDVTIIKHGTGIAIRLTSSAEWNPSKTADEYVTGVTSADITVDRAHVAATVKRTVSGSVATRIAATLNAFPTGRTGGWECGGIANDKATDTVVFHTSRGTITAVNYLEHFCSTVDVTVNGAPRTMLYGDMDLQILAALKLPKNYGEFAH